MIIRNNDLFIAFEIIIKSAPRPENNITLSNALASGQPFPWHQHISGAASAHSDVRYIVKATGSGSMNIIIPACGRGERFKAAGYAKVKPLISIYGESMVDRVISALHLRADDDLYVVSNWGEAGSHKTILLEQETVGATETVLLALKKQIKDVEGKSDAPLLLLDCDAIYHCDVVSKFRELESEEPSAQRPCASRRTKVKRS